jgi:hypothetical protein
MNRNSALKKQVEKSIHLLKRLFSIKLVWIVVILLIVLLNIPFVIFLILKPVPMKDPNYGVTFSNRYSADIGQDWKATFIKILDDLKIKNMRLVVYWDDVEKVKDTYNYSDIKWQLDEATKRKVNVILAIGQKVPRYPECFAPKWWKDLTNEAQKDSELYEYIGETVTRLKGYGIVKMWQVENEPFWPFGICEKTDKKVVENEIKIVRSMDSRPIIVQDSGEGGFWFPTYKMGDYLGISMYRKFWYDFWGRLLNKSFYVQYPIAQWMYKVKANMVGVPVNKILVTEVQGEPWGPGINSSLSQDEKDKSMSPSDFIATISYAQKSGFKDFYFWGVEWWLWQKEVKNEPFYWDTAKALVQ